MPVEGVKSPPSTFQKAPTAESDNDTVKTLSCIMVTLFKRFFTGMQSTKRHNCSYTASKSTNKNTAHY